MGGPRRIWPVGRGDGPGSWARDAACRGRWSLFDPPDESERRTARRYRERIEAAKHICGRCPVLTECRQWRDEQPKGVVAGVVAGKMHLARGQGTWDSRRRDT